MSTVTAEMKQMFIDGKWCDAENGKTYGDRFEGSYRPIQAFIDSMKHVP